MIVRSSIHINEESRTLNVHSTLQETWDHLLLKLAAYLFFFKLDPTIETGPTHAQLQGQDYWPDVMATDAGGQIILWVECGKTTLHKLEKVSRRFRDARIIVLTAEPHQAKQQAEGVAGEGLRGIEIWSFAVREFARWAAIATEKNDIIGESSDTSLNLVINDELFVTDLERIL